MIWYVSIGLAVLLALSVPVGAALFILGFGLDEFFSPMPLMRGLGQMVYSSSDSFLLIAIPLFVLLGEKFHAGHGDNTYVDFLFRQLCLCGEGDFDFGPRRDQNSRLAGLHA